MQRSKPLRRGKPLKRSGFVRSGQASQRPSKQSKPRNGSVTPETAQAVIERDKGCVAHRLGFALDDGCSGRGHIHHVVLRSQGGGHDESNLIVICEHHHDLAHNSRRSEAEEAGVIRRKEQHIQ
jgi:5-methylcytosine-specific restriction endonuclease McrA